MGIYTEKLFVCVTYIEPWDQQKLGVGIYTEKLFVCVTYIEPWDQQKLGGYLHREAICVCNVYRIIGSAKIGREYLHGDGHLLGALR